MQNLNELKIDIDTKWLNLFKKEFSFQPKLAQIFVLDPKSEVVERKVYEFFQMLADIGGFTDGLELCVGYLILLYNSRSYFITLSNSLLRVSNSYSD